MAALCKRAGHDIFALWFLLSSIFFFSSPNLSALTLLVGQQEGHPACKKMEDGGGGH